MPRPRVYKTQAIVIRDMNTLENGAPLVVGSELRVPTAVVNLPAKVMLAAAHPHPGSRVRVRTVGTNPTRTGLFDVMRQMGAGIEIQPLGDQGGERTAANDVWA